MTSADFWKKWPIKRKYYMSAIDQHTGERVQLSVSEETYKTMVAIAETSKRLAHQKEAAKQFKHNRRLFRRHLGTFHGI